MIRKIIFGAWYLFVGALLLLALLISILRAYPSIYQNYLPEIQNNISSILGKPVRTDDLRIDWYGITPFITANNLSIYEDETEYDQLLNVDKATITLDLYKTLINKAVTFKELSFIGGNLEAVRTSDEKIILNGIDISERLAQRKKLAQEANFKINLLNSSISIVDEIKNLNYFFDRVDIIFGLSGETFKVLSKFTLPETLGDSLDISADIRDLDKGLVNIKGNLYAKGTNINLELLNDLFPKFQVGIKQGSSSFELWGKF